MKKRQSSIYFIEHLNAFSWLFYILPNLLRENKGGRKKSRRLYFFSASKVGLQIAHLTSWAVGGELEAMEFDQFDIKDQNGESIWLRLLFKEVISMYQEIKGDPLFKEVISRYRENRKEAFFLTKRIMCLDTSSWDTLLNTLFYIKTISWKVGESGRRNVLSFYLRRRPWMSVIRSFALKEGVVLIEVGHFDVGDWLLGWGRMKSLLKWIMYRWMTIKYSLRERLFFPQLKQDEAQDCKRVRTQLADGGNHRSPKIAVEYYGQLNLDSPELYSDLFFYQASNLFPNDMLIYFNVPGFPVTDRRWNEITKHRIPAIAINSRAVATPYVPVHHERPHKLRVEDEMFVRIEEGESSFTRKCLYKQLLSYYERCGYWFDFFTRYNIKLHVSWYNVEANHCVISNAIERAGGASVIYQRSFEGFATPWIATVADVYFSFSKLGAHLQEGSDSIIPYYVITGYLGDHRFSLLSEQSTRLRDSLKRNGATKVISFFDENSITKNRGVEFTTTCENYTFLLNKVLENPWLGLVIKPKIPATLRKRLGQVTELLDRAEKTGRCFVFTAGDIQGAYPPAAASLAADIAIHGHLFAGTAGIESALAGTPTLILDREGCSFSPLYELGEGRVIFKNWNDLWVACRDQWNSKGIPGFGNWSSMIDEFDPFRDGHAAERMGTYLKWILEGFRAGLSRDTVLADAAERYCKIWGKDKILSINCNANVKEYSHIGSN